MACFAPTPPLLASSRGELTLPATSFIPSSASPRYPLRVARLRHANPTPTMMAAAGNQPTADMSELLRGVAPSGDDKDSDKDGDHVQQGLVLDELLADTSFGSAPTYKSFFPDRSGTSKQSSASGEHPEAPLRFLEEGEASPPSPALDPEVYDVDPIVPDAEKLKRQRETVTLRRAQLSRERGEADATTPRAQSLVPPEVRPDDIVIASVRASLPFAQPSPADDKCSELLMTLTPHAERFSTFPWSYRPSAAFKRAITLATHDTCPRCGRIEQREEMAKSAGICSDCYTHIYLSGPPVPQIERPLGWTPGSDNDQDDEDIEEEAADGVDKIKKKEERVRKAKLARQREEKELLEQARAILKRFPDDMGIKDDIARYESKGKKTVTAQGDSATSTTVPSTKSLGSDKENKSGANGTGNENGNGSDSGGDDSKTEAELDEDGWNVIASDRAKRTINPIRNLVQNITVKPNPAKELIKLSVGDPTVYGNLQVSAEIVDTYSDVLRAGTANGYSHSTGLETSRAAVAARYSGGYSKLTSEDVILTGGASGALELVLGTLANEGDNILLPQPGFPLFTTLAEHFGIECRYYRLRPHDGWRVELGDLSKLTDIRTRAIVVNNPSNPCGSVFSRSHVESVLQVAAALRLPVVSDEVYADMVFGAGGFTSFGTASRDVPVLAVGAVSKQFVVPGWRLGWVLVHDRAHVLRDSGVTSAMRQMTTRMIIPNTPAQAVLPHMFRDKTVFDSVMQVLDDNATFTVDRLNSVAGLRCIKPQGAMYAMVMIDVKKLGLKDDMEFVEKLLQEEAVFALPGQCFQAPNFIRVVFSAPRDVLAQAFDRIEQFCNRRVST